eukprot:TRINITY_DN14904_c0_g1_i1.p1 TRINITY_DN14904_c0_g1~~TRINITY_DN14904_c0_g1_i1.p1  ORF type:complete len:404 (-),score=98.40 TRINITY_DN14904_c0_g1_i1:69-1280(-)
MTGGAHPVLAAFGNPLLDIIVNDEAGELVERFNLEKGVAQEIDTHETGLYDKVIEKTAVEYAGGGCALNTVRVFQWLSEVKNEAVFLGGLGTDESGDILETLVNKDGVLTAFAKHQDLPTGHCIALVDGAERTLCANLGAATKYDTSDLWNSRNIPMLQNTKVIYVEGYFLAHSFETTMELATFAQRNQITFVFNLCGEYVCEDITYVENALKILPFVDIMFGNRSEFDVFINTVEAKLDTSHSVIKNLRAMITGEGVENLDMKIENICESPVKSKPKSLIVVVTEGCQPVQCYSIGDRLKTISVPVPKLDKDLVKDTIGAGDSFISGFIYVFIREGSLRACIEYAIWTAQKMIQQVGVTLPDHVPERHLVGMTNNKKTKRSSSCGQDSPSCNVSLERKKIKS